MPVDITITLSEEDLAALLRGTDPQKMADAIAAITKGVVVSVQEMAPKMLENDADDERDDDTPTASYTPCPRGSAVIRTTKSQVQIFIKSFNGRIQTYNCELKASTRPRVPDEMLLLTIVMI